MMSKNSKKRSTKVQQQLEGHADMSDADNSGKLENQNQEPNTKQVSLGANTLRR